MRPNIVLQAPIFSQSGYGAHARDIVLALWDSRQYNISVAPTGWGGSSMTSKLPQDVQDILTFVAGNPIRQNAAFTFIHLGIPTEFRKVSKTCNIGYTAGIESDVLPPGWSGGCNLMDAVVVPTAFVQELFVRCGVTVPVYAVGEGVDTTVFNNFPKDSSWIDFPTSFNFLTGGQWLGNNPDNDRKGIGKLVRLFCEAFADNQDVGLVIKSTTVNNSSPDWHITKSKLEALKKGREFPKIHLLHGELSEAQLASLYVHPKIKAFVSCTSGESWGRMVAEAAASDLPLLLTGWSGYKDYLLAGAVTYFDYELATVPGEALGAGTFVPGMKWAWAKDDDVKRYMKRCHNGYEVAKEWAIRQGEHVRLNWSRDVTGKQLVDTFVKIIQPANIVVPGSMELKSL